MVCDDPSLSSEPVNRKPSLEVRTCYKAAKYDECRIFYEKVLEWSVFKEWNRSPRDRGVVYSVGGAQLELLAATDTTATRFDGSLYLYVETLDLETLWERIQRAGHTPTPMQTYDWGHRSFAAKDPSGFVVKFFTQIADQQPLGRG